MDFLTVAKELGLGGVLLVFFIGVAQLGLTQLCKLVIRTVLRKRRRALGLIDVRGESEQDIAEFGGLAVIGLSLGIGAVLGGWMLQDLAVRLSINLSRPWGGVVLGLVLAGIVSGYVNHRQAQASRAGGNADVLAEALAALQTRQPVDVLPSPVSASPQASVGYDDYEPELVGDLRPASREDVDRNTREWYVAPGLDNPGPRR